MPATAFYEVSVSSTAQGSLQFYMLSLPTKENIVATVTEIKDEKAAKQAALEQDDADIFEDEIGAIAGQLRQIDRLLEVLRFLSRNPAISNGRSFEEIQVADVRIGLVHVTTHYAY